MLIKLRSIAEQNAITDLMTKVNKLTDYKFLLKY